MFGLFGFVIEARVFFFFCWAGSFSGIRFAFSCEHPYPSSQTTTWMLAEDQMEIGERPASQVLRCFALCSSAQ